MTNTDKELIAKLQADNKELVEALKIAREALEFYANLDWKQQTEVFQHPAQEALAKLNELGV